MTRDSAIDLLMAETKSACTKSSMEDFIDMAVALGLLKLDEPKSGNDVLTKIIKDHAEPKQAECILGAIKNAKLKIEV